MSDEIRESTVRLFKKRYLEEIRKRQVPGTEFKDVTSLPQSKRGRKMMLGEQLNCKVQNYIKALHNAGTPIGSSVVMAAAEGLVRDYDRSFLVEYRGHIAISKTWAPSLLGRMGYVKRKATAKSTPGMSSQEFERVKTRYLKQIARMVTLKEIPDSLIINVDPTGIKLVPTGDYYGSTGQ